MSDRNKIKIKSKINADNRIVVCKICKTHRGLIRKYNLDLCRRCFKDNAERLGFKKYD